MMAEYIALCYHLLLPEDQAKHGKQETETQRLSAITQQTAKPRYEDEK